MSKFSFTSIRDLSVHAMTFMHLSLIKIGSIVMRPSIINKFKKKKIHVFNVAEGREEFGLLTPTLQMGHATRSPNPVEPNNHATRYWAL